MNTADWFAATGSTYVGLGGGGFRRPVNPTLLARHVKGAPSKKSTALAREARRLIVQAAKLTGAIDDALPPVTPRGRARAATRSPSVLEQSAPGAAGAAARMRHMAVIQRWRK